MPFTWEPLPPRSHRLSWISSSPAAASSFPWDPPGGGQDFVKIIKVRMFLPSLLPPCCAFTPHSLCGFLMISCLDVWQNTDGSLVSESLFGVRYVPLTTVQSQLANS